MSVVPKGVAHVPTASQAPLRRLSFVLVPDLTMMAFTSAVEALRWANQLSGRALYDWQVLSLDGKPVRCSNGIAITVDGAIGEAWEDSVLFVCSGNDPARNTPAALSDLLRYRWRRGGIVGGLCTGAYGLARAGVLAGHRFTLHWENLTPFRESHPTLDAVEVLYVRDRRIWTCAGGSSALDLMLDVIAGDHGPVLARAIADMGMHPSMRRQGERQRPSPAAQIGTRHPGLLAIITAVEDALNEGLDPAEVPRPDDLSDRQVQRLFRKYLNTTPQRYIRERQLERARALLQETSLPLAEIAAATSFPSRTVMTRWFRETYGVSPHSFRRGSGSEPEA